MNSTLSPQAAEILAEAIELISDKKRWTQHISACDKDGNLVKVLSPKACKWCAIGAINHAGLKRFAGLPEFDQYKGEIYDAFQDKHDNYVTEVNDYQGHSIIIEKLKSLLV